MALMMALHLAACAALLPVPPPFEGFTRGVVESAELPAWWRQDSKTMQFVVGLPEDASFKKDVALSLSRRRLSLAVHGTTLVDGELAHECDADSSEWFVESDLEGFDGRCLVIDVSKKESYVDWQSLIKEEDGAAARRLRLGGKGEVQKQATAQQLASYQVLQKLPSATRGDVYAQAPCGPGEEAAEARQYYFVGKVISEAAGADVDEAGLALAAQEVLVKEHARLLLPSVFGPVDDDAMSLWLAPGNSEMRIAQNEIALRRWLGAAAADVLPAAGACGFEPETAPPPHMGVSEPFAVTRDGDGRPLGEAFAANVVRPDEVPGAFEAWLKDHE